KPNSRWTWSCRQHLRLQRSRRDRHVQAVDAIEVCDDPLRIYGVARTRAFRALWIAKELDLDYEHVPLEIGPAGARKADYLAINPTGRLPAIDDGGFVLWESLAITLYLAKKHGRLYPTTLEGEAKAWQWSLWSVQEVDRGVNIWSLHAVRLPPADRDPQPLAEAT